MKLRNLCLAAVVAALSLPAFAAEPVNQTPLVSMNDAYCAVAAQTAGDERIGFQALDENQDGFISRDEAKGTYLARRFDALDTDHDGRLSPLEVGAAQGK